MRYIMTTLNEGTHIHTTAGIHVATIRENGPGEDGTHTVKPGKTTAIEWADGITISPHVPLIIHDGGDDAA